jgi:hypothetical protein
MVEIASCVAFVYIMKSFLNSSFTKTDAALIAFLIFMKAFSTSYVEEKG